MNVGVITYITSARRHLLAPRANDDLNPLTSIEPHNNTPTILGSLYLYLNGVF